MFELFAVGFVGIGMFFFGWFAHAWLVKPEVVEAEPVYSSWRCPQCERQKHLPAELDDRVKVCNNCNVRLVRAA